MSCSVTAIICPFLTLGQQLEAEMRGSDLLLAASCWSAAIASSPSHQHSHLILTKNILKKFLVNILIPPTLTGILVSF